MTSCKFHHNDVECIIGPANGVIGIVYAVPVVPFNDKFVSFNNYGHNRQTILYIGSYISDHV